MDPILYYLVDPHGKVYAKVGADSFADLAREFGLTERECQPLLNAGIEYQQACAAEWIKLFRASKNRIDAWKN